MINLEKFINGEVVFKVTYENVMDFLDLIESTTSLVWRSGDKPTKFVPPNGSLESLKDIELDFDIIIGVAEPHTSEACLYYMWDSNYIDLSSLDYIKIEIYK